MSVAICALFMFIHGKVQWDLLKILKCTLILLLYDEGVNNDDEICRFCLCSSKELIMLWQYSSDDMPLLATPMQMNITLYDYNCKRYEDATHG